MLPYVSAWKFIVGIARDPDVFRLSICPAYHLDVIFLHLMALCLKIFGLFYPFLSSSHCLVLEGLSCIWGIFPGGPSTLGSHLVHSCTHVSSWFPHCSEVPWESYSGGVPFCRFLGSPILHWVMCVCFTLSDCVLSGLKGFLFWCLLLLHPPNCGAFGCS